MKIYNHHHCDDKEFYRSLANRPLPTTNFSRFRGVQKNNDPKRPYRAGFKYAGRAYWLGSFDNELDAARAYNEGALRIIGDHAILNDIPPQLDD